MQNKFLLPSSCYLDKREEEFVLTIKEEKAIFNLIREFSKRVQNIAILQCCQDKKNNPKLSLRELAGKYRVNKDTINKWLKSEEEVRLRIELVIKKEGELYLETMLRRLRENDVLLAKSSGVRDQDIENFLESKEKERLAQSF